MPNRSDVFTPSSSFRNVSTVTITEEKRNSTFWHSYPFSTTRSKCVDKYLPSLLKHSSLLPSLPRSASVLSLQVLNSLHSLLISFLRSTSEPPRPFSILQLEKRRKHVYNNKDNRKHLNAISYLTLLNFYTDSLNNTTDSIIHFIRPY